MYPSIQDSKFVRELERVMGLYDFNIKPHVCGGVVPQGFHNVNIPLRVRNMDFHC